MLPLSRLSETLPSRDFPASRYWRLLSSWTRRDYDARYRRSGLRAAWAVLQPFTVIGVYAFIFGIIFDQVGGDVPYLSYLLSGMVVFRLVAAALNLNSCFVDNYDVLSHSSFPREIVPLAQVLGASVETVVLVPSLVVVAAAQGITPSWHLVALPLVMASVLMLAAAACIAASTVQAFIRDTQFVVAVITQGLFFASPISYQMEQMPPGLRWLNTVNPISVDIEAVRAVVLYGRWPDWPVFGAHVLISAALLAGAIAHVRAVGHRIVDLA